MLIVRWFLNALALLIVAWLLEGHGFRVTNFYTALIAALVLGFVNATLRWVLIVLTLPVTILTLGLFTLVINALMILLVSTIVKGFDVAGFGPAFLAAILLWGLSFVISWLLEPQPFVK